MKLNIFATNGRDFKLPPRIRNLSMALPIIFFHYGNPAYLKYALKQAHHFNPDSRIYLIGDKKNNKYPFLTHVIATNFEADTQAFRAVYKHMTSNDEAYELNCFLRWFYMRAVCKANNIEEFIYLDSDVLAFQNFTELTPIFKDHRIANTCDFTGMPAFTWFKDFSVLDDFCNYLLYSYRDKTALAEIEKLYQPFIDDPTLLGGISDMVLFHLYFQDHPEGTLKLDLINDEIAIDISINREDGYEMENGIKKVYWQEGLPYCKLADSDKLVRFATLHYQGSAKPYMRKNFTAGGYTLAKIWEEMDLKARFKRFRRSLKKALLGKG
jgi:hypothetical protein